MSQVVGLLTNCSTVGVSRNCGRQKPPLCLWQDMLRNTYTHTFRLQWQCKELFCIWTQCVKREFHTQGLEGMCIRATKHVLHRQSEGFGGHNSDLVGYQQPGTMVSDQTTTDGQGRQSWTHVDQTITGNLTNARSSYASAVLGIVILPSVRPSDYPSDRPSVCPSVHPYATRTRALWQTKEHAVDILILYERIIT